MPVASSRPSRAAHRNDFAVAGSVPWQPSHLWQTDSPPPRHAPDESAPSHGLSQVVLEGSLVNLEVTSPAATLALALMYLKTNDASAAAVLALPETAFELDFVRPFYVLLRILARALIMWDTVQVRMAITTDVARLHALISTTGICSRYSSHLEF